jgi:hypothetical protein
VIGVVSLTQYANINILVKDLLSESAWSSYNPESTAATRLYQALYPKHKAKAIFLESQFSVDSAVEIANMCDILLLVVHANPSGHQDEIIDQVGDPLEHRHDETSQLIYFLDWEGNYLCPKSSWSP